VEGCSRLRVSSRLGTKVSRLKRVSRELGYSTEKGRFLPRNELTVDWFKWPVDRYTNSSWTVDYRSTVGRPKIGRELGFLCRSTAWLAGRPKACKSKGRSSDRSTAGRPIQGRNLGYLDRSTGW